MNRLLQVGEEILGQMQAAPTPALLQLLQEREALLAGLRGLALTPAEARQLQEQDQVLLQRAARGYQTCLERLLDTMRRPAGTVDAAPRLLDVRQ